VSRLVLIRHGESEWNVERRIQGQSGTGLSTRGLQQAHETAQALGPVYPDALLATSDIERCRVTAAAFGDVLGAEPLIEAGLRERHFGAWTGRLARDVATQDRERWERWRRGEDVVAEVGGEDTWTLVDRVVSAYHQLLTRAAGRPVICITHGGSIYHGVHALLGLDSPILGGVANCSVTELAVAGGDAWLESWNQVTHLPPALRMLGGGTDADGGSGDEPAPSSRQEPAR
jgi:broad specificity phosphatase PhoE